MTKDGDTAAGIDGRCRLPETAGISLSTGAILGGQTHGQTTADERVAKQEPPVAPEGIG